MNAATARRALDALAARYWNFLCHEQPLMAIAAGVKTGETLLFRESLEDHGRRDEQAQAMLSELSAIPALGLSAQERATRELLRHELETLCQLHEADEPLRPSLFPNGPTMQAFGFANTTKLESAEDAELYVERLASLPRYLEDLGARVRAGYRKGYRYPRRALDVAASSLRSAFAGELEASPWLGPFRRAHLAERPRFASGEARCRALLEGELPSAFEALAALLTSEIAEDARSSVGCSEDLEGGALYRAAIREYTTSELEPEAIHDTGLEEVERLLAEMRSVAADAGHADDLEGYRRQLASPAFIAPSKEALLEELEVLAKRIDAKIPSFFGRIPRITYGIECMPEAFSESMPPAYAQPNPADRSAPGIFWLTALPERMPRYMKVALTLHEAWPGHLMHVALLQECEHLPAFRQHGALRYSVCLEGWALYCEGLGVEMGVYQTPHEHYGRLESELWRAVRLVVDTGLHAKRWGRQQAVDFMAAHLALPRPTIEAEVERYIAWPAQALSYQLGKIHIEGLRERAESALGERFRLRDFHDTLMDAGPASLPVLSALVEDWIAGQKSAGSPAI